MSGQGTYIWEGSYARTWMRVGEDESGALVVARDEEESAPKAARRGPQGPVLRGMDRYVCVVLDNSPASADSDFPPSRFHALQRVSTEFVHNFFDANPLCQLCVTSCCSDAPGGEQGAKTTGPRPGIPATVSALSGDPRLHERGLSSVSVGKGQFSLQRSVEHAVEVLDTVPAGAVRELLFLLASTSTFDERDIATTLMGLEKNQYRCSVVSVSCEVHVMRQMTQVTGGSHAVATTPAHLRRLMEAHITPPPLRAGEAAAKPTMQVMGFPKLKVEPGVCACHLELRARGYECPRCGGRVCNLPGDCAVCRLRLADPSHLARSYHHLMPAALYKPVARTALDHDAACRACGTALAGRSAGVSVEALRCEGCAHLFCDACDAFVHEVLHNCPGCLDGSGGGERGGQGGGGRRAGGMEEEEGEGGQVAGASTAGNHLPAASDGLQNEANGAAPAEAPAQQEQGGEPAAPALKREDGAE